MASPNPIPAGYSTVTPSLVFTECAKAIEFYKQALGAQELARIPGPDGKIMHAEIKVGNAHVMMNDEVMGAKSAQTLGGSPVSFYLYVDDADGAFRKATAAGCKPIVPMTDMFWGDRMGVVSDPYGYKWNFATRVKELTPDEMKKGQNEWMKQMAGAH